MESVNFDAGEKCLDMSKHIALGLPWKSWGHFISKEMWEFFFVLETHFHWPSFPIHTIRFHVKNLIFSWFVRASVTSLNYFMHNIFKFDENWTMLLNVLRPLCFYSGLFFVDAQVNMIFSFLERNFSGLINQRKCHWECEREIASFLLG